MFNDKDWRTIWTSTVVGHLVEGQVRRSMDDEIESRMLIDGHVMTIDTMPDTSASTIYFPTIGGFVLVRR